MHEDVCQCVLTTRSGNYIADHLGSALQLFLLLRHVCPCVTVTRELLLLLLLLLPLQLPLSLGHLSVNVRNSLSTSCVRSCACQGGTCMACRLTQQARVVCARC